MGFFSFSGLRARDLDRVRSFRTFCDLECDGVTFAELIELDVQKLVRVEEEISLCTIALDESEALVCKTGDCSSLHWSLDWSDKYCPKNIILRN